MSGTYKKGISKQVIVAEETTFGTLASGSGRLLRRVNAVLNLNKDAFESQEILPSQQIRDARHGMRRASGSISGQLSPGSYTEFWEGMLRRAFAAGATASDLTVTAAAGPPGTFTRGAGSWLTDGFKVGDVVRFTGFTSTAAVNNTRNYRIQDLTATVMTVSGVAPEAVVAATTASSIGCAVVGKKTFIPATGHLFKSYSLEEWLPDGTTATSNRYLGMTMQSARVNLPPTGLVTCDFQMMGQDMTTSATQAYASPSALSTDNSFSAVTGKVRFQGADVAYITGGQFQIACQVDGPAVVGSNLVPAMFPGALRVSGSLSALIKDNGLYDIFNQETEVDLLWYLPSDTTANSAFMAFTMNRIKLMSNQRTDGDRALIQSFSFSGLEHLTGAGTGTKYENTTITIQDSSL